MCRETIKVENNNSKKEVTNRCTKCRREGKTYSAVKYPLKKMLKEAEKILEIQSKEPLKGVKILMGKNKSAEPLEKGILRQKYDLYAFKDGTIRFDATNEPLTHFKPKWIMTNVDKLKELGYSKDFYGKDLSNEDQLLEIFIQDVVLPIDTANHLLQVSKYIDKELLKLYKLEPFYNATSIEDLIGHIIIGLAPHTSVGIIGRIIGYTNSQVCLASPMWHSAKRRDCDGDADSIMLLMDVFLNFSKEFLPDKIGGLMDAPLLVQPIVLPHEVQRQALNMDVTSTYPLQLYEKSLEYIKAENLSNDIDIIKNRIGSELQFYNYFFTHHTNLLTVEEKRSAYSRLNTMNEKLDMQISTAKLINAVIPDEVASMVLTTHIIPDIMGNMRSYSSQAFRCTNCREKYRRIPIAGKCLGCGNNLIQTVTRNSVEKYVYIALDIRNKFKMNDYLSSRIESLVMELNYVFKEKKLQKNPQSSIFDFMDH
jgi:DNA polymerase II large subunit